MGDDVVDDIVVLMSLDIDGTLIKLGGCHSFTESPSSGTSACNAWWVDITSAQPKKNR